MIKITLKDGSVKEAEQGATILEVAKSIHHGLAKEAVAGKVNGKVQGLDYKLEDDCELEILKFEDEDGRHTFRHTSSHVLAQAVKHLFPEAKLGIGPAIDNGFYYDFDLEHRFTDEDLAALEKEMAKIVQANYPEERFELPREEAIQYMEEKQEPYKVELIRDLPEDAVISFYKQGDFTDLCAGPHMPSTGAIKAIKLMSVAGLTGEAVKRIKCCREFMLFLSRSRSSLTNIWRNWKKQKREITERSERKWTFLHFSKKDRDFHSLCQME